MERAHGALWGAGVHVASCRHDAKPDRARAPLLAGGPAPEHLWRVKVRRVLEHKATDLVVIGLILVSVGLMVVEALLPPGGAARGAARIAGDVITALFAVELTLRFVVARSKRQYVSTYWIDVLSVLPLLRVFRVFRVLRLLRVFRAGLLLNRRISMFSGSVRASAGEAIFVFVLLIVIVLVGAFGVHMLESGNASFSRFDDSFWWSFFSFLAGEPIEGMPRSAGGKLLAVLVMTGGMTIFAMLTGIVSATLVQRMKVQMNRRETEIELLDQHVVICGWNRALDRILEEFQYDPVFRKRGVVLVAELEEPPELDEHVKDRSRIFFMEGDYTRIDVLRRCGLDRASTAILLADKSKPRSDQDRDARTVLAAMLIEKTNPRIFTCVELLNRDNEAHIRAIGVEEIVVLDDYGASIMATASQNEGMVGVFNELFTRGFGHHFCKIEVAPEQVGQTVRALGPRLKEQVNALLIAVERPNESGPRRHVVNPPLDFVVEAGDRLVLITNQDVPCFG